MKQLDTRLLRQLEVLEVRYTKIALLDTSGLINLIFFDAAGAKLTKLSARSFARLQRLDISRTRIAVIGTTNLRYLAVDRSDLTVLDTKLLTKQVG